MEIKASCKLSLESCKALTHLQMFRKADPRKRMLFWSVIYALLALIVVGELVLSGPDMTLYIMLAVLGAVYLLEAYWYFLLPRLQYGRMAKLKDTVNMYTFGEESIQITSEADGYHGTGEALYSMIFKVCETSAYFFIFQTKQQVFLVDKTTVTGGTAEMIREKLQTSVSGKYIICKY